MKSITIGKTEELCSKCRGHMIIKGHRPDDIHIKKQKQYFTQWNYCLNCRTQWFNPEFLVINTGKLTPNEQAREYLDEVDSLFKNLS